MKIQPVQSQPIAPPAKSKPQPTAAEAAPPAGDVFQPEQTASLMETLRKEPDARPEQVERARALAADPAYPSEDVLARLAERLIDDARRSD